MNASVGVLAVPGLAVCLCLYESKALPEGCVKPGDVSGRTVGLIEGCSSQVNLCGEGSGCAKKADDTSYRRVLAFNFRFGDRWANPGQRNMTRKTCFRVALLLGLPAARRCRLRRFRRPPMSRAVQQPVLWHI